MAKGDDIKLRRSIFFTLSFVLLIWIVKLVEFTSGYDFGQYGIFPRTLKGSIGIFVAPLIHGDVLHLISNTFPIIILGIGLFYFYDKIALWVITLIYFMTGFWVWVAARDAYHIGASGLVYGVMSFLLVSGFLRRDPKTLAISFVMLFLYGGTFLSGVLPTDTAISWESHLMGAIAGIFCAVYHYRAHPAEKDEDFDHFRPHSPSTPEELYRYYYLPKEQEQEDSDEKNTYLIEFNPENEED